MEYNDGLCLKDLDKIGRDIKRVCIIDNDKNNFKLHVDNGIEINSKFKQYLNISLVKVFRTLDFSILSI